MSLAETKGPSQEALKERDPERYEVLGEHGRGGLGRVARARDKDLGRDVAIKEILNRDGHAEARFIREAMITARLEHPGIVPIHEAGCWPDGTPFYVMKLVAGLSLKELIEEKRSVQERLELLHHVIAVADAMAYAHVRQIVHRDLKPANVIAGDFGETVVIDWGLAKDLTVEETEHEETAYRCHIEPHLTRTGAVVGTPLYMAPEQARGERVDQHADVFAIGAMLWELCSLHRVPPEDVALRRRILRRGGIDEDLIAIVEKAIEPEPSRRYRDAGELARDLKAFKSGARIAARKYSVAAVVSHWVKRHRAVAASFIIASVLLIAGIVVYLRNVTAERDRADNALAAALDSQAQTDAAKQSLVLENADLLLRRDPTAAIRVLASYRGEDIERRVRLEAEARGRGIAAFEKRLHTDAISVVVITKRGEIVTLGNDGGVRRMGSDGSVQTLATDLKPIVWDGSRTLDRIAFQTNTGVSMINLGTNEKVDLKTKMVTAVTFSVDGKRLALCQVTGTVLLWRPADGEVKTYSIPDGVWGAMFYDEDTLVVYGYKGAHVLDMRSGKIVASKTIGISYLEARNGEIALAAQTGELMWLDRDLDVIDKKQICGGAFQHVKVALLSPTVVFACRYGYAGRAVFNRNTMKLDVDAVIETDGVNDYVEPSEDGRSLAVVTYAKNTITFDADTRLPRKYWLTEVPFSAGLSAGMMVTGDKEGNIRVWKTDDAARLVSYSRRGKWVRFLGERWIVHSNETLVSIIDMVSGQRSELKGHLRYAWSSATSDQRLLTQSIDQVRLFDAADSSWKVVYESANRSISGSDFLDGEHAVIADGTKIVVVDLASGATRLYEHSDLVLLLKAVRSKNRLAFVDSAGVWLVDASLENARRLQTVERSLFSMFSADPIEGLLAVSLTNGTVKILDPDGRLLFGLDVGDVAINVEFDPRGKTIVVLGRKGSVFQFDRVNGRLLSKLDLGGTDIAFSDDGSLLAIGTRDGGLWVHNRTANTWLYDLHHTAEIFDVAISKGASMVVTTDFNGRNIVRTLTKSNAN